jgi:hypothetical protein
VEHVNVTASGGPYAGTYHVELTERHWVWAWDAAAYIIRRVEIPVPDCIADVTLHFCAKVEDFESGDEAQLMISSDGTNWDFVQTWSSNGEYQCYDRPIYQEETVCLLWIGFRADMYCNNVYWDWWALQWACGESDYFYVDDVVVTGIPQ